MRKYKHSFQNNPASFETQDLGMLSIEGEEGADFSGGAGGDQGDQGGDNQPFNVSKEDWDTTRAELEDYKGKFGALETQHREFTERFKPFLENPADKDKGGANADPEPQLNDPKYSNDRAKYARDLIRWESRQEFKQLQQQSEASAKEQREAAEAQEATKQVYTKLTEADKRGAEKFQDYHQVVAAFIPLLNQVPSLPKTLARMKNPEDIAYHFGKNPQEAYTFANQANTDPDEAMRTLILLDHRFSEAAKTPANNGRSYNPTPRPGGKSGAGETMSDRVKSAVWAEITGQ